MFIESVILIVKVVVKVEIKNIIIVKNVFQEKHLLMISKRIIIVMKNVYIIIILIKIITIIVQKIMNVQKNTIN